MTRSSTLVDVRGQAEFSGEQRRAARGGHIPGPFSAVGGRTCGRTAPCATRREIRARAGRPDCSPGHELVTYCQGGVRAAHAALALRIAGYQRVRTYDGSWAEWGNDPRLPIEATAAPAAAA